jgi:hypothetical protein
MRNRNTSKNLQQLNPDSLAIEAVAYTDTATSMKTQSYSAAIYRRLADLVLNKTKKDDEPQKRDKHYKESYRPNNT